MIGVRVLPVHLGSTTRVVAIWFGVASIAALNACLHILGITTPHKYSPGVITGVALYLLCSCTAAGSWSPRPDVARKAALLLAAAIAYDVFPSVKDGLRQ